jgi:AraC-like DNA-binding protein
MALETVAAGIVAGLIKYSVSRGASEKQIFSDSGLSHAQLSDQDARIPMGLYKALVHSAIEQLEDAALPLRFSVSTDLRDFSIVGLIVHASASVDDAFKQLARYSKLMVEVAVMESGARFTFESDEEGMWLVDNRPNPNEFPALTEFSFGRVIGEFAREFPQQPFALEMQVTHPEPAHARDYEKILSVPVRFNQTRNAIRMNPAWLKVEFAANNEYAFGIFIEHADALLKSLENHQSLQGKIEAYILPRLHLGDVTVDKVANAFAMSRKTLHRRLKEEGVTFLSIHDDLKHRMAIEYLTARKVSVNQVAYLVGFSEPSSFVRAFRRWRSMTPSEFLTQNTVASVNA